MVERRVIDGRAVTFRHETGRGPALLCIHGAADNHHVYDPLLDALSGHECYALNLPGRAQTDGPPAGTVAEMASFFSAFVESEVKGGYVVVGHSLGGAVAIEHALSRSAKRLRGIVLLATGARLRVHPMILQLFERLLQTGLLPQTPPGLYGPHTDPALIAEASKRRELTPVETGHIDWHAANGFDRMHDLEDIHVPALIIAGTHDPLTPPKYAEFMATKVPNSTLRLLDGAGHMLVMERALEVASWIRDFLPG